MGSVVDFRWVFPMSFSQYTGCVLLHFIQGVSYFTLNRVYKKKVFELWSPGCVHYLMYRNHSNTVGKIKLLAFNPHQFCFWNLKENWANASPMKIICSHEKQSKLLVIRCINFYYSVFQWAQECLLSATQIFFMLTLQINWISSAKITEDGSYDLNVLNLLGNMFTSKSSFRNNVS